MPRTLYADGFLFQRNPSQIGGGFTIVDSDGNLVERKTIIQTNATNNEVELLAVKRALELVDQKGKVITDSQVIRTWIKRGRSKARHDLVPLIRQCQEMVLRRGVRIVF